MYISLSSILVAPSLNSQGNLVRVYFLPSSDLRAQYLFCVSLPVDNLEPALRGVIPFNHLLLKYLTRTGYVPGTMRCLLTGDNEQGEQLVSLCSCGAHSKQAVLRR